MKTEARISLNNKPPSANLSYLSTLCLILVSYPNFIQLQTCGQGRREHTRCQKSPDLRLQPMQFWSEKSEIGKSRQHVIPARSSYRYPRHPSPFHASTSNSVAVASTCASPSTTRVPPLCTRWCKPALSGPFNVFDPWSKLFYKYIHVRRAWPSLGQVHSEFGSELEQPLASRLHWTKGRNMSDKLSKTKNTKNLKTKSFDNISQTLASLPGTQMIVQSFSGRNQPMPEDNYCHSSVHHSWPLLHVGL